MERVARSASPRLVFQAAPQLLVLLVVAGVAWAFTVEQSRGMSGMPGTMGKDLFAFAGMWGLMMTAMMLPSAAPFATLYSRTFDSHRLQRALQFALGYLVIWTISGVPAFALAWIAGEAATAAPMVGTALAVAIFAGCGVYPLTPLKYRCLSHCRTPLGDVLHYSNYRGRVRDLRVGLSHGAYCLACCWALMALMAAFGFMTLLAMAALAGVVAIEKLWSRGEAFGRATGVVALGLAVAVIFEPGLAPGLDGEGMMMPMG